MARFDRTRRRRGAVVVLIAFLMIPVLMIVAFAVDYGFLLVVQSNLQRAADSAALAAAHELVADDDGSQDASGVRNMAKQYATYNTDLGQNFAVADADIELLRYDPATIYSGSTAYFSTGTYDTVRVTLRRDNTINSPVSLFFSKVMGFETQNVSASATAVLRRGTAMRPGADVLPFSLHIDTWNAMNLGDEFTVYGDQRVLDEDGNVVPGNWGTVDIGSENNSTADISDQILNGLRQVDLDALASSTDPYGDPRIPTNTELWAPVWVQADPGLSAGLKNAVEQIHGQQRMIPLYDSMYGSFSSGSSGKGKGSSSTGGGNNPEFHVVGWGVVKVITSDWQGAANSSVTVRRSYMYDGALKPQTDLSTTSGTIEGAFTAPALIE
jgi:Flp pilus assembly protein TadG